MFAFVILLCIFSVYAQLLYYDDDCYFEGYHEPVGIPAAAIIRAREEAFVNGTSRIYDGWNVDNEQFPFFAGILAVFEAPDKTYSACGASLVSADRLLTAAHCWYDGKLTPKKYIVILGSQFLTMGGLRVETDRVVSHPDYEPRNMRNDIGVVVLPHRINFTRCIFPIALPVGKELNWTFAVYTAGVLGYGKTKNDVENKAPDGPSLKFTPLRIMFNTDCQKHWCYNVPGPKQMCTNPEEGSAPCEGDSGGPLFTYTHRKILVGIFSSMKLKTKCGEAPALYTRVTEYIDFIARHVDIPSFSFEYRYNQGELIEKDTITLVDPPYGTPEWYEIHRCAMLYANCTPGSFCREVPSNGKWGCLPSGGLPEYFTIRLEDSVAYDTTIHLASCSS